MASTLSALLLLLLHTAAADDYRGVWWSRCSAADGKHLHTQNFTVRDLNDTRDVDIGALTGGHMTLVVNVATFCGLTQQYHQMNALIESLKNRKFKMLAFPCNQFGHQEQGKNASEILNGLKHVRPGGGFEPHPLLTMFTRGDVNGAYRWPVYQYLTESCPPPKINKFNIRENFWNPIQPYDVSWNFEKFLVTPNGSPIFRFHPRVEPWDIQGIIELLMGDVSNFGQQREQLENKLKELDMVVTSRNS